MKKFIYIFVSVFIGLNGFSQTIKFNYVYGEGNLLLLRNIISKNDGYVGLGGEYNEYGRIDIFIAGFDLYGNWIWQKNIGDSTFDYYHGERNSLIENTDGGYSLAGHRRNPSNNYRACMLIKFDQNFDTLWTKLYFDNPDFTAFYNHIQTSDGGYALVGSNDESEPDGDVLLVKTDSDGNMQWYKKYGTSVRDLGVCIIETPDKGFLIGGGSLGYGHGDNYIIKTDSSGNQEWTKNYGSTSFTDGGITNIIMTQDSGYVFTASHTLYEEGSGGYLKYGKAGVKKLDKNYNDEWYHLYGETGYQTTFGSCVETPDGRLVLTLIENLPSRSKMLFLTSEGDSIRKVDYVANGSTAEQWLLTIKRTQDDGFIMAGVAYDPQVMWLVKTDSCGCVTDDCECGENTVQEFGINAGIQVFPNPSIQDFTVKLDLTDYNNTELKITDLNGHLKSVIPVTGETTEIITKGWSAGTYICNLFVDRKLVKTEKLVLE